MREEFHGIANSDGTVTTAWKQLYGWGTINANVWLPSLMELVGIDSNHYHASSGVYYSAMQGLNISSYWYVDAKGGNQFAYFKQYNASGGGEKLWNACKQEQCWLRTPCSWTGEHGWIMLNPTYFHAPAATESHAVHPAGQTQTKKIDRVSLLTFSFVSAIIKYNISGIRQNCAV